MKIGFVGAGRIGSTSAFTCLQHLDVEEIAIVDILEDLAVGEAMDLSHAAAGLQKYPEIKGGSDYGLLKGSEIVVVSAGLARKPGMSRLDLATRNAGIIRDVAKKIMESSPESKILVVTNPMDIMNYIMWKETGKPRNEVFGMGGLLDSSRLKERMNAHGAYIRRVYMLGEHGDSMFPAKSLADFDGEIDWKKVEEEARFIAAEVIKRKGATIYGPAVCIYHMVKAVVGDTKEEIPASVVLDGEYGIRDVALGVPVLLGRKGVEKIVEYDLTAEEMQGLKNSARILRERLKELGY
jgi:malate dehydrogenase